jgi:peptide deformylase
VIRDVLHYPDRRLKQPASAVSEITPGVRALVADLWDTAASYPRTVGIAAPQIGAPWRVCIIDCTGHKKVPDPHGRLVLINPTVLSSEGAEVGREGCLSLPEITANVRRPRSVVLEFLDLSGETRQLSAEGFEARVILHEIDHLDGVLILDRVASITLDVFERKRSE